MRIYNTADTIWQGAKAGTDTKVLKRYSRPIGAFQDFNNGSYPAEATPDGRPLAVKLLYPDLPNDMPRADALCRVSVVRYKPCANPHESVWLMPWRFPS